MTAAATGRSGNPAPGPTKGHAADIAGAELAGKQERLHAAVASLDSAIVAFSGGVDSAFLASFATRVLGPAVLCVTADSPSYPDRHRQLALRTARELGLRHEFVRTSETERADYRANPVNRCYFCKHELYTVLSGIASARGFQTIVDGSNADDRGDYRPGRQAAREFGVRSPLDEAGLTKSDIRLLARQDGLSVWDEPASACLSSRIPYHSEVTDEKLRMIEEAEAALHRLGFRVYRVRHHDTLARIEIGLDEMPRVLEPSVRDHVVAEIRAVGYQHVTIDLRGYRRGSLNDGVQLRPV